MVRKLKELFHSIRRGFEWDDVGFGFFLGFALAVLLVVGGCGRSASAKPEVMVLRPGQSAVLMEDVSVLARIPAQGRELYSGPVVIERGTIMIKPKVEQRISGKVTAL